MKIRAYKADDLQEVVSLWRSCGLITSNNNPHLDIARKLEVDAELFLVVVHEEKVIATAMGGYEGHRGWVNYLAVDEEFRNQGLARELMEQLETLLREMGCPKINLQVRSGNTDAIKFYRSLGFQRDDVVSLGKRLSDDN